MIVNAPPPVGTGRTPSLRKKSFVESSSTQALVVLACYALVALIVLYKPLFNLSTHLTGEIVTDYFHFHWNFWWIRHALTNGLNIYETNYVMAPFTSSLALHTLTVFWYPLWALIEPLFGTVPAMTAIFLTNYVLCGFSFYWLMRREGVSPGLALVGGIMLELTPLMFSAPYWTTINIMAWFWLPVLIVVWGELARTVIGTDTQKHVPTNHNDPVGRPFWASAIKGLSLVSRTRGLNPLFTSSTRDLRIGSRPIFWTVLLAFALWSMILTDIQYPLFAAFLIVPYGLLTLWRARIWAQRVRLVVYGAAAVGISLALLWFAGPLRYILAFDRAGLAPTPADRAVRIPFPEGFISRIAIPEHVSVGGVLLPLLVIALLVNLWLWKRRSAALPRMRWFWLALVILPLLFTPGAYINIGETQITMPYLLLHNLFGGIFRYPERFTPVFLIPAVLFIMLSLTPLIKRNAFWRWVVPVGLVLIVIGDSWMFRSVAIQPIPYRYAFYEVMGREPYDYVVIESPTGGSSGEGIVGEQRFAALEWYGMTHGKRMVNGHISRVNFWHFWFMRTDDPLLAWLGQRRFPEPELIEPELHEIIPNWPVGYLVIHQDMIGRNGPTTQEIIGYLNSLDDLLCPVWIEKEVVVYRTFWHPDGCPSRFPPETEPGVYTIDIGTEGDERFIGWGWHWLETVGGATTWRWTGEYPETKVYVDLPPGDYTVSLAAQAFWEPRQLQVLVNDRLLSPARIDSPLPQGEVPGVRVLTDSLQTFSFALPAEVVEQSEHLTLTLVYDKVIVPSVVGQSADPRKLAVTIDWIKFTKQ